MTVADRVKGWDGHGARIARGPDRRTRRIVRGFWCAVVGLVLVANLATLVAAQSFRATVTWVDDGDTVWTLEGASRARVRLDGIDCPEIGQPFGLEAKQFTSAALLRRQVVVTVRDVDTYGRLVSRVTDDGRDVSVDLVRAGLAWYYSRFSSDPVLAAAEREARASHRGLWSQPHPEAPWDYRARMRADESTAPGIEIVRGAVAHSAVAQSSTSLTAVPRATAAAAATSAVVRSIAAVKRAASAVSKSPIVASIRPGPLSPGVGPTSRHKRRRSHTFSTSLSFATSA